MPANAISPSRRFVGRPESGPRRRRLSRPATIAAMHNSAPDMNDRTSFGPVARRLT